MEFYIKLKQLRKGQGMSQEELAGQLNVSRQAVSKWESGQGFPETDKLLIISNIFGVSLDYLLKDNHDAAEPEQDAGYYVSREMAQGYLAAKSHRAKQIALGVAVIILSISLNTLFDNEIGTFLFFICVAAGVAILVMQVFRPKRYDEIEKQPLIFDADFMREFRTAYALERKRRGTLIAVGIIIIILSFPLNILVEDILHLAVQYEAMYAVFWALGVAVLINNISALAAYEVLIKNKDHLQELKDEEKSSPIFGVGFLMATALYLAIGLLGDLWHPGWVIFPVTALVCTALSMLFKHKGPTD